MTMTKPKLALDHDSTLAATAVTGYDLMHGPDHDYDPYDSHLSWEWPIEKWGAPRFLNSVWHAWTLRPLNVPLMDETVVDAANELSDYFEVHIVTAHPDHMGITEGKKMWLDHYGIQYEDFVVVEPKDTKAKLKYDAYVDDKPTLPESVNEIVPDATVYLRDQVYNREAGGDYIRVKTLQEVVEDVRTKE